MYSNLTKSQTFSFAIRISSQTKCVKQFPTSKYQSFPNGSHLKLSLNPAPMCSSLSHEGGHKTSQLLHFVYPEKFSVEFHRKAIRMGSVTTSDGFGMSSSVHSCPLVRVRRFSSNYANRVSKETSFTIARKRLPWLASKKADEAKRSHKVSNATANRSSWEESAEKLEGSRSSWEESVKRLEKVSFRRNRRSLQGESTEVNVGENSVYLKENEENRCRIARMEKNERNGSHVGIDEDMEEEVEGGEEEEVVDSRWNKIKNRFRGHVNLKASPERSEIQRWNKQENWGRRTWKEATESSIPKMVGESVYGVGPVLAALSAGRREFYTLFVQEGLDFSSNNRKKKDKKGFEKVLRMAEKSGLSIIETSKHDLNMVVDNRPHQGLVLDASPLEMVKIKELDPVSSEEGKSSLWVALDEVTDPQNLGAIIRSAYFFGASGVVLCAKNSAPLSGVVSKASAGSLELMELRYCKNMMQFLISSAENGWRVLGGSVSSKAAPLNEILPGAATILVLGSEGTGLRPLVERSCTQLVRIPGNFPSDMAAREVEDMAGTEATEINSGCSGEEVRSFLAVESLNVSVAAGVLLHHLSGGSYKVKSQVDGK